MTTKGRTWGFHAASRDGRKAVDPILLVDPDPDTCRMIAHRLAPAGYSVEWTIDPIIAPARVSARRFSLLLAREAPDGVSAMDPDLPVLHIGNPIDLEALVVLVGARAREAKERKA